MIVLVDTNILLDHLQERAPHDRAATAVWRLVEERALSGYVSAISFNNVFYIARKSVGAAKAIEAVKLIRRTFLTVPLDETILDRAISSCSKDLEDSIQSSAAASVSAEYIITRNAVDFGSSIVPTVTAEELLAVLGR
jgi:predicted nucleic acid-binding protein